jgi:hypothetical protein
MVRLPGPLCCFNLSPCGWMSAMDYCSHVLMRWIWLTVSHGVISFLGRAEPGLDSILYICCQKWISQKDILFV